MAYAPTGPRRVTINRAAPVGGIRVVMSNYDVDVDVLKPDHASFLSVRVVSIPSGKRARSAGRATIVPGCRK